MKDGTVQGMFWSGGLPTSGITDLTTSLKTGVRFVDLSAELGELQARYGQVYQPATVAPEVYGQPAPVRTIGVPNLLVVKDSMDAGLAEKLTAAARLDTHEVPKQIDLDSPIAARSEIPAPTSVRVDTSPPVPVPAPSPSSDFSSSAVPTSRPRTSKAARRWKWPSPAAATLAASSRS